MYPRKIENYRKANDYTSGTIDPHASDAAKRRNLLGDKGLVHPDGKAWAKCCCGDTELVPGESIDCAFTAGRLSARDTRVRDTPFICIHREEDGHLRVCAGWDACFGKQWRDRNGKE